MAATIAERALEELRTNITLLDLATVIIDSILIFSIIFLATTIFQISVYYAFIPSILYFIYAFVKLVYKKNQYLEVEEKVPDMNEKLRTVADNVYRTNPILDSLKEDVVRNMDKVKTAKFIDYNSIAVKLLFLTLVSIIIIIISFLNVNFDFSFGEIPFSDILGMRAAGQEVVDLNLTYKQGNISDILGNGSVARLGNKELQLSINPLESDVDINSFREAKKQDFNPPAFPKEIYTSYDVSYNEKIAKQNQKVVKNYFELITR